MDEPAGVVPSGQTAFQAHVGIRYFDPPAGSPPGTVVIESHVRDDLTGPAGSLEGGVVATLVDVAGASCAAVALKSLVATQAMTLCYLAPVRVGPARATATTLRVGERDAVVEVRLTDRGRDDRLCTTALLTAVRLEPRTRP